MPNEQEKQQQSQVSWLRYIIHNRLTKIWNPTIGKRFGMMTPITREGKPQAVIGMQRYLPLLKQNDGKIADVGEIESKWAVIEEYLFGPSDHRFEKEPKGDSVCEQYRKIEYFRDHKLTLKEAKIFQEFGTIEVGGLQIDIDLQDFKRKAENNRDRFERKIAEFEAKQNAGTITPDELKELGETKYMLDRTNEFLDNPGVIIDKVAKVPHIKINESDTIFIDGRAEKIVAIGKNKMEDIIRRFATMHKGIDTFASSAGIPPLVRTPIGNLLTEIGNKLKEINEHEFKHGEKTSDIASILVDLHKKIILGTGVVEDKRPTKSWIRFAHTYKIIKPYRISGGIVVRFKDEYPDFKREDELESGLDENGWPLEVYEDPEGSDNWYVLLDKWWVELSENRWHVRTILKKPGGKDVLRGKVSKGVKRPNGHTHGYRSGYVRKVPAEYVGDVDPLDKISFISNETDSFRDDFRDGRYHPHSKSSMDYIIAGGDSIIPEKPINFEIETENPEVRIKFRPIYYTNADTGKTELWGTLNPNGGMGKITTTQIPEDERQVSRRYTMDTEFGPRENQIREPTHLNPAFDRAALSGHVYIHWGRMYYYEPSEGVNRWSENPFPHISTRGFAKYLINLVLRRSFSYSDARNALRGHAWDYGVRHYGEPFTEDPLGPADAPGGALWHAKEVARKRGGG